MTQRNHHPAALATGALLALWLAAAPASAGAAEAQDCVWGQKGYRECVDKLLAEHRTLDPSQALRNTESRTHRASPTTTRRSSARRRPGAGSLTPTPPADLRITPPTYDPAQEAIAADRRQRDLDNNLYRMQRDSVAPPIMPPVINPPYGRICPSWGC
jgi:hypothetical protein